MWIIKIYWKNPYISKLPSLVFMLIYFILISWQSICTFLITLKVNSVRLKLVHFCLERPPSPYHLPYGVRHRGPIVIPRHYLKTWLICLLIFTFVKSLWMEYKRSLDYYSVLWVYLNLGKVLTLEMAVVDVGGAWGEMGEKKM